MTDLEHAVLSWLAAGNSVFRPRDATREDEEAFRDVVSLLARLRAEGHLQYPDRHVARRESGIYLMVGPVALTPKGRAALERDRALDPRPERSENALPWRA